MNAWECAPVGLDGHRWPCELAGFGSGLKPSRSNIPAGARCTHDSCAADTTSAKKGPSAVTASTTCPVCGMTSSNPTDIAEGYCGYCHDWTSLDAGSWGGPARS